MKISYFLFLLLYPSIVYAADSPAATDRLKSDTIITYIACITPLIQNGVYQVTGEDGGPVAGDISSYGYDPETDKLTPSLIYLFHACGRQFLGAEDVCELNKTEHECGHILASVTNQAIKEQGK